MGSSQSLEGKVTNLTRMSGAFTVSLKTGPEAQDRCQGKTKNQAGQQGKNMADGAEEEP